MLEGMSSVHVIEISLLAGLVGVLRALLGAASGLRGLLLLGLETGGFADTAQELETHPFGKPAQRLGEPYISTSLRVVVRCRYRKTGSFLSWSSASETGSQAIASSRNYAT